MNKNEIIGYFKYMDELSEQGEDPITFKMKLVEHFGIPREPDAREVMMGWRRTWMAGKDVSIRAQEHIDGVIPVSAQSPPAPKMPVSLPKPPIGAKIGGPSQ
jgi:hypothetical protein